MMTTKTTQTKKSAKWKKTGVVREDIILDEYEQEVHDAMNEAIDNGTFKTVDNFEEVKNQLAQMAKESIKERKSKTKMVSIKRDENQLAMIKKKAFTEWMKYQTFIKE